MQAPRRAYDLDDRLLEFSAAIIAITEKITRSRAGNHIADQLLRSGTAPYGNHGEAEGAESTEDFIHKMKICFKELRETRRWLRLLQRAELVESSTALPAILMETDELIRIFYSSIRTAKANHQARVTHRHSTLNQ